MRSAEGLKADVTVPYERVVFLTNDVDNHFRLVTGQGLAATREVSGYNPQSRIVDTVPTPRAGSMFSCEPALSCYQDAKGRSRGGRSSRK
jgi:hypothetical protein